MLALIFVNSKEKSSLLYSTGVNINQTSLYALCMQFTSYKVSGVSTWEAEQWTAELVWSGRAE